VPRQELEGDLGSLRPGAQARMMSQNLRRLTPLIGQSNTTVVFINQTRSKIGGYGNPETTAGGNALKFYASVRLDIRRIGALKRGDTIYGNRVKVKVVKNKLSAPFRFCEFDLIFGQGISWQAELTDYGVAAGALKKAGSWYSYEVEDESERIGQGRDSVVAFLDSNQNKTEAIRKAVGEYLCGK
jgi:recombination protein RecA